MTGLGNLWRQSARESFEAPGFQGDLAVDLVIIGAGFTGLSAALAAAGQGATVAVLEANTVGHGGSGRNVGLVNAGLWLPPDDVCRALGEAAGEHLNTVLGGAPDVVFDLVTRHAIDCEPRRAGTLHLAHAPKGEAQLKARLAQMQARGAPVQYLAADEVAKRTASAAFGGALFDARAGTIQPLAYARGLARAAAEQGARIYEQSPVTGAARHGGQWVVTSRSGKIRARRLLVATNAYHQPLAHMSMPSVPVVQYFQLATKPLAANLGGDILAGGEGAWDTGLIMTSIRRDEAGRVIIGGMGSEAATHTNWAERKLARLFPRLAGFEIEHAWSGKIAMTQDHLPRILRLGREGLAIFGYSGRGIGPGTVFGRAAALALLSDDESGLPVPGVDMYAERFCTLKALFYETGARLVHLGAARS
ncbi:Gamma-glutamylputrescine oxidoreductase [Roseovarius gaetbuli]|uniref:Gamma-glutamylputrescine oxidoreductase n=1 Tax=Roseovarius gaetbuli TaxID=1356575 RepID=A0A1X6Y530_9RHOB|nr:FAD-dependent oxidoreductase [Roseovarius gaetbuli]SLN11003.1 Gamma-glutamylputrescine oxidoreductase [Roseovarius gaetbuli]